MPENLELDSTKKRELEAAELRYQRFIERRDKLNEVAKLLANERDEFRKKKEEIFNSIEELKNEKHRLSDMLLSHKQKRDEYNSKFKLLLEKRKEFVKKKGDPIKQLVNVKLEIQDMEMRQQTVPMSLEEENRLIDELRRKCKDAIALEKTALEYMKSELTFDKLNLTLDEFKRRADAEHQTMIAISQQIKELNARIIALVNESATYVMAAKKKHEQYLRVKAQADLNHQRARAFREKVLLIKKDWRTKRLEARKIVEEQNIAVKRALEDHEKLEQIAENTLHELKQKGRIQIGQT